MPVYAPARANPLQRLVPPFQPEAEMPSDHPLPSSWIERGWSLAAYSAIEVSTVRSKGKESSTLCWKNISFAKIIC